MPEDLTMCPGTGCPLRDFCYRHLAVPSGRQDSFTVAPWDPHRGRCDCFIDVATLRPTEAQVRDRAYFLWCAAGRTHGHDVDHWHAARVECDRAWAARLRPR